jgi:hypothetical protein
MPSILTIVGLVLDAIGAGLLFWFGFPSKIDLGGLGNNDKGSVESQPLAKVGFALLFSGFVFQLAGTLCNA